MNVGQTITRAWTVEPQHLACTYGSGLVDALATPALVAFCEETARLIPDGELEDDRGTVGTSVQIEHLAPTPTGMRVEVTARLVEVDGRRLRFEFEAKDEREVIARGSHERFIIEKGRFEERLQAKASNGG